MNIKENKNIANTKTIILHVGVTKTGITSIQKTLFNEKNRELLAKKGYLFPKCWGSNHSQQMKSAFSENPHQLIFHISSDFSKDEILEYNKNNIKLLKNEIRESLFDTLIISGEDISKLNSFELQDMKQFLVEQFSYFKNIKVQFTIIFYVRNPQTHSSSRIQNLLRAGLDLNTSFKMVSYDIEQFFREKIENFMKVFGKNNIHIFKFEDAIKNKNGVSGHFLSQLVFNQNELSEFNCFRVNNRISMKCSEIIGYVNQKQPLLINQKHNTERIWGDTIPLWNLKGPKFDLIEKQKRELFSKALPDMLWLKENFGIDYNQFKKSEITSHQTPVVYTGDDCLFIQKAFKKLSPSLRAYVISFFEDQLKPSRFDQIHQNTFVSRLKKSDKKRKKKKKQTILSLINDYRLIFFSGLFDKAYYFSNYPDIKAARKNPIIHYIRHGACELRNPSEEFNTAYYLKMNKDVLSSGMNPLVHYVRYGKREGRNPKKIVLF